MLQSQILKVGFGMFDFVYFSSMIVWFFPPFYFFPNKIGQFQKIWHRSIVVRLESRGYSAPNDTERRVQWSPDISNSDIGN